MNSWSRADSSQRQRQTRDEQLVKGKDSSQRQRQMEAVRQGVRMIGEVR
jgi:hypothetical protein